jgi:hypothetical protein
MLGRSKFMIKDLSREVEAFAKIARQYCDWVETSAANSEQEMEVARKLLAKLHAAALDLPDLGVKDDGVSDPISHEAWQRIYRHFLEMPLVKYWDVFDPLKKDKPILNNLADDLADIYRDVKNPLALFDEGNIVDAVWEWRVGFQHHWGHHLTGAQRALHSYFPNNRRGPTSHCSGQRLHLCSCIPLAFNNNSFVA